VAGAFLGPHLSILNNVPGQLGSVSLGVVGSLTKEEGFGIFVGEPGQPGEFLPKVHPQAATLGELAVEFALLILEDIRSLSKPLFIGHQTFQLLIDEAFPFGDALLRLIDLEPAPRHVLLGLLTEFEHLLIGQEPGLTNQVVGLPPRVGEELLGPRIGLASQALGLSPMMGSKEHRGGAKQSRSARN